MSAEPIRVLIVDDHEIVGEALTLCLEREHDIVVVGTTRSGRQALNQTLELSPDVLLLDLRMPGLDGLQVLAALQSANTKPTILIMTAHPNSQQLYKALTLGASGYITKDVSLRIIPDIIRTAVAGKTVVVSPGFPDSLGRADDSSASKHRQADDSIQLSDEQYEILSLVARGMNNVEIGQRLSVSARTVKAELSDIYTRIGVRHRTEAGIWAEQRGLVPSH